jgi:hypothetical protein
MPIRLLEAVGNALRKKSFTMHVDPLRRLSFPIDETSEDRVKLA